MMQNNPFAAPFGKTTVSVNTGTSTTSSSVSATGSSKSGFNPLFPPATTQSSITLGVVGTGGGLAGQPPVLGMQPSRVFGQTGSRLTSFVVERTPSSSSLPPAHSFPAQATVSSESLLAEKKAPPSNPFSLKAGGNVKKNLFGVGGGASLFSAQPATAKDPIKSVSDSEVSGLSHDAKKQAFHFSTNESPNPIAKPAVVFGTEDATRSTQPKPTVLFGGRAAFGAAKEETENRVRFTFSTAPPGSTAKPSRDAGFGSSASHLASRAFADLRDSKSGQGSGVKRRSEAVVTETESGEKKFRDLDEDSGCLTEGSSNVDTRGDSSEVRFQRMQEARAVPLPSDDDDDDNDNEPVSASVAEKSGSLLVRRMSSFSEDTPYRTVIECKGIPAKFNQGAILRKHFQKFGRVVRVTPNPSKASASIHFTDYESASQAKQNGRKLGGGPKMQIFWRHSPSTGRPSHPPTPSRGFSRSMSRDELTQPEPRKSPRSQSKAVFVSSEVAEELASMAGSSDVQASFSPMKRPRASGVNFARKVQASRSQTFTSSQVSAQSPPFKTSSAHQPSPPPELPLAPSGPKASSSLTSSVGKSAGERFQILDARDKMIRQSRKKPENYAMAKAFVGNCPDMCPEKERYEREDKRRLHFYEILSGTDLQGQNPRCDHARAVKEYSRSSADQEEPLPQELRPLPVLGTTMNYLLSEIADRGGDGKWADWFNFFWDRTRCIRKEITQQQLNDEQSAALLEKCARFHIYCAERLCEEDMASFDDKINDENLTKCLQTLKEFYTDLAKQGTFCRNEAQFRAFMVLMNINEGDTLREVQQLRAEVLNSAAIGFAVKVYLAVSSNNFVRFFRLVKQASFLEACILHRYFTQVRSKALLTILRAYRSTTSKFPLDHVVRMLSFEDEAEAVNFCRYFGLVCEEGSVRLESQNFVEPESAVPPRRAITLIESKLHVSVGEVINGEPLPPFVLPQPTFSFDEQGHLLSSAKIRVVEMPKETAQQQQPEPSRAAPPFQDSQPPCPPSSGPLRISNEVVKGVTKDLFLEVIHGLLQELSADCFQTMEQVSTLSLEVLEGLLAGVTSGLMRQVVLETVDEKRRQLEKAAQEEHRLCKERASLDVSLELLEELTGQEVLRLATAQMREVRARLQQQCQERATAAVLEEVNNEAVVALVWELAAQVFEKDVVQRREALAASQAAVELRRAGRFLLAWRKQLSARLQRRRAMATFPCAPPQQSLQSQLKALLPDREDTGLRGRQLPLTRTAFLPLEPPMEVEQRELKLTARLSLLALQRHLDGVRAWQPLPLPRVVAPSLHRVVHKLLPQASRGVCLLWKLIVSLPQPEEEEDCLASKTLRMWLVARLSRGYPKTTSSLSGRSTVWSLYSADVAAEVPVRLGVCVRGVWGILVDADVVEAERQRTLLGTSGLLFLLDPVPDSEAEVETFWLEATLRLARLLQAKPVQPALPLVVLVPHPPHRPPTLAELGETLELERYQRQGLLAEFRMVPLPLDPRQAEGINVETAAMTERLSEGLAWLASFISPQPRLEIRCLREFVEDFVMTEFSNPVLHNLRLRRSAGFLHQPMAVLVDLYNAVVLHLAKVAGDSQLAQVSWPIPEFTRSHVLTDVPPPHWNLMEHLQFLEELLSALRLPEWEGRCHLDYTWSQVCQDIWHYVAHVVGDVTGSARVSLSTRIKSLLCRVEGEFAEVCWLVEGEAHCAPTAANVPWTDIVQACISFRLSTLDMTDQRAQKGDGELTVVFDQSKLDSFQPPLHWTQASHLPDLSSTVGVSLSETVSEAAERHREELRYPPASPSPSANEKLSSEPRGRAVVPVTDWMEEELPSDVAEVRSRMDDLSTRVRTLQAEQSKYEKYLLSVVNGTNSPKTLSVSSRLAEQQTDSLSQAPPSSPPQADGGEDSPSPHPATPVMVTRWTARWTLCCATLRATKRQTIFS